MAFARIYSTQTELLHGRIVTVEVDTARGLNHFTIVGLGDRSVEEARDRVGSALKNSGFNSPKTKNQKTVVSLSPADLKKEGSHFDVAIAIAYLLTENLQAASLEKSVFIGELALDGTIKPIKGVLPMILHAKKEGFDTIYLPRANAPEALLIPGMYIFPLDNLTQLVEHLDTTNPKTITAAQIEKTPSVDTVALTDFSMIIGQESVKRGLTIAAAGGHNILMYGPPGSGKTTLAKAFVDILPALDNRQAIEVTSIHSIFSTRPITTLCTRPPLRTPHHTASCTAVLGGGANPRPGEITLAHRGVLFLDEFPEFDRRVIEALRQPLEERTITLTRAKGSILLPANCIVIAAMNPCPCGFKSSKNKQCTCTMQDIYRYQKKLSGPLLDRIDITLYVGEIDYTKINEQKEKGESKKIQHQVTAARARAYARALHNKIELKPNSDLTTNELKKVTVIAKDAEELLIESATKLGLSARGYQRTQKIALTIADLDDSDTVAKKHILEALRYRSNCITN